MDAGDVKGAAGNLAGSKWAKQVGGRASDVIGLLESSKASARDGGMFSGPESGYLVALHGKETVTPNFGVPDMNNMAPTIKQPLPTGTAGTPTTALADSSDVLSDMMDMLEEKFDDLIDAVQSSNDTQSKILRNSRA